MEVKLPLFTWWNLHFGKRGMLCILLSLAGRDSIWSWSSSRRTLCAFRIGAFINRFRSDVVPDGQCVKGGLNRKPQTAVF